jgi:hypothetical protein
MLNNSLALSTSDSATINLIPPIELAKKGVVVAEFSSWSQQLIPSCSGENE